MRYLAQYELNESSSNHFIGFDTLEEVKKWLKEVGEADEEDESVDVSTVKVFGVGDKLILEQKTVLTVRNDDDDC